VEQKRDADRGRPERENDKQTPGFLSWELGAAAKKGLFTMRPHLRLLAAPLLFGAMVSHAAPGPTVIEFYNSQIDRYFITSDPDEAAAIDQGSAGPGWTRTGDTFPAGGNVPVCRFYGSMSPGPNSHFYTASTLECEGLKQLQATTPSTEKRWNFESFDFNTFLPVETGLAKTLACPSRMIPVYRVYNNGFARGVDSNHRITPNRNSIQQVLDRGWIDEGVVMCAPNSQPTGTYADCLDLSKLANGTTIQVDVQDSTGARYRIKDVVTGPAIFETGPGYNGAISMVSATENSIDLTYTAGPLAGTTTDTKRYSNIDGNTVTEYGTLTTSIVDAGGLSAGPQTVHRTVWTEPPVQWPLDRALDTEYVQGVTTWWWSSLIVSPHALRDFGSVSEIFRFTYLGIETVTVPAGTFQACKTRLDSEPWGSSTTSTVTWNVASGKYKTYFLKSEDNTGVVSEAVQLY
jgi:hypothetical protein